nr:MAG: hypothetical protein 1 [Leviviridae sp.]
MGETLTLEVFTKPGLRARIVVFFGDKGIFLDTLIQLLLESSDDVSVQDVVGVGVLEAMRAHARESALYPNVQRGSH